MSPTTQCRQRALIIGLRFLLSVGSSWIQSAPATAAPPHPGAVAARAVELPIQFVLPAIAVDKKSARAMSVRRLRDRH